MNERVEYLRRRRELLIVKAATQRSEVSSSTFHLQKHLRSVDMCLAIVRAMRKHPIVAAASAALVLRINRNKLLLWSGRLLTAWKFFHLVRNQKRAAR